MRDAIQRMRLERRLALLVACGLLALAAVLYFLGEPKPRGRVGGSLHRLPGAVHLDGGPEP